MILDISDTTSRETNCVCVCVCVLGEEEEDGGCRGGLVGEGGSRILGDYRARHQRITASEDKIYM